MSYQAFQTLAFTQYGIPNQILEVVRPWVEKEIGTYHNWGKGSSLGYAELADIQTVEAGMKMLNEIIWQSTLMETPKKTAKEREKFLKDAGGRVGKGFYRYALKTYYLTLEVAE
jgi:hypothetical protein